MVVSDSSSLILLAKIGLLDRVVAQLRDEIIIPTAVYKETATKKQSFDALLIKKRVEEKRIVVQKTDDSKLYSSVIRDFNLGRGEAEAIVLCLREKSALITDDKKAIQACKVLKIEFTTVPNIVTYLFQRKIISKPEAQVMIEKLQKMGRYSAAIIQTMKDDIS